MITLLIVSVALAAMAPMISKNVSGTSGINIENIKNQIIEELKKELVPKGSIMFFNGNYLSPQNKCPEGWINLVDENAAWAGRYFRVAAKDNIGTWQASALPNIIGDIGLDNNMAIDDWGSGATGQSRINGAFYYDWRPGRYEAGNAPDRRDSGRVNMDASRLMGVQYSPYGRDRNESDPNGTWTEVRPSTVVLLTCQKS